MAAFIMVEKLRSDRHSHSIMRLEGEKADILRIMFVICFIGVENRGRF